MATEKYRFGCVKSAKADWLVQSASQSGSAQEALALNEEGEPVQVHYYQNVAERTLEVIIPKDDESDQIPEVGEVVSYAGKAYYVASASTTETNTDWVRYSISLKRFTKAGEHAEGQTAPGLPSISDAEASI
jgi:hypothetical protein